MRIRAGAGVFFAALGVFVATTLAAGALTGTFTVVDPPAGAYVVFAEDLNDAGQITGGARFTEGGSAHAFLRDADGTYTDLDPSLPSTTTSGGHALNTAGDVVGHSGLTATLWPAAGGGPIPLGTLAGDTESIARDINDDGVIVGSSYTNGTTRAWVRDPVDGVLVDMGTLPGAGDITQVEGINDSGVATGWVLTGTGIVGFTWTEAGGMEAMPFPPGVTNFHPLAINNAGQVVGNTEGGFRRAFVWDPIEGYTELTMDGYKASFVYSINDTGLAVGHAGGHDAAVWDLVSGDAAAFPVMETTAAISSQLQAVNSSDTVMGITLDGDDWGVTFVGQIDRDAAPVEPPAAVPVPAEPVPAAPSFTG